MNRSARANVLSRMSDGGIASNALFLSVRVFVVCACGCVVGQSAFLVAMSRFITRSFLEPLSDTLVARSSPLLVTGRSGQVTGRQDHSLVLVPYVWLT